MGITYPGASYADPRYGVVKRAIISGADGVGMDGLTPATSETVSFPTKIQILGFGIQGEQAQDVVCSTDAEFRLETGAGTALASIVFDATTTIGSGDASVAAIETATTLGKNTGAYMWIGTNTGTTGSIYGVVDYIEQFDAEVG